MALLSEMPRIFWAGDSTVKQNDFTSYPQCGIGQGFSLFVKKEILIVNRAENGRSTKSFIDEGRLEFIKENIRKGDFLFIQFGHNDATIQRPERYVSSEDFHTYIQQYIDLCREKAVQCILVTPVARRNCDDTNVFKISFDEYRQVMLKMAPEQGIPVIDLGKKSAEYLNTLGNEKSKELYLHTKKGEYEGGQYENSINTDGHSVGK